MRADPAPILRDLVLVGGGHSHVGVLRSLAMRPLAGLRVTLVCDRVDAPYSGMLPGYVAGHYGFDDVHIDLAVLCQRTGARLIVAEVVGLDRTERLVLLRDRPPIPYDRVSVNIGSTPSRGAVDGALEHALAVKPIAHFNQRWLELLRQVRAPAGRMRIAVVGAGAGGIELLLAMQLRLARELASLGRAEAAPQFALFSATPTILPTHAPAVRRRFEAILRERGVEVHPGAEVVQVAADRLRTRDGRWHDAGLTIWVTQAGGADWLASTGLALDARGFLRVHPTLQSISDPAVFAAGDIAAVEGHDLAKAGVFAVRMGPVLAGNLRRSLTGASLQPYRPQRRWLALISTGERHAVASRGWFHAQGPWVWRWKDWIDRRFMRRFNELEPMPAPPAHAMGASLQGELQAQEAGQLRAAQAMRCGGCGAKVGAAVLERALAALPVRRGGDVLVGLGERDDAAVVRIPAGKLLVQSVDFFRAMVDDPWLFGRIAANHALGDLWAMGATPHTASVIATLPPGLERQVQAELQQMMSGAVRELEAAGCALVGGHSGEGRETALGFAVNGLVDAGLEGLMSKRGLRPGDCLVLTKPLGTGVLLAGHARSRARGRWLQGLWASMLQPGAAACGILRAHGASGCTDVTGFGLLGHLMEMARASDVDVQLELGALPWLDGALACSAMGVASSLLEANLRAREAMRDPQALAGDARWPLLFDPQTAGGLLAGVAPERAAACVAQLRAAGYAAACVVGRVLPRSPGQPPIDLRA